MNSELTTLTRCQPLLGTYVEISIEAGLEFKDLAELSNVAFDRIREVQEALSFHDADSELSRINRHAHLAAQTMSLHMAKVIRFAVQLSSETKGIFDPTIAPHLIRQNLLPNHHVDCLAKATWKNIILEDDQICFDQPTLIDLGGIAKGYAVDQAYKKIMTQHPSANVIISAGGDLIDSQWKQKNIHIRHPLTAEPYKEISMQNLAIASSSYCYQEAGKRPIIDAIRQAPVDLTANISIFAPDCMTADALTKVYALQPDSDIHLRYDASPVIIH